MCHLLSPQARQTEADDDELTMMIDNDVFYEPNCNGLHATEVA